jgi:hypothetical protein
MNDPSTIGEAATVLARALRPETVQELHRHIADGLAAEDGLPADAPRRAGFRKFSDFKEQADAFEAVMQERSIAFTPIRW